MKQNPWMLASVLVALVSSLPARAEIWQGAGTHRRGDGAVGAFGKAYFDPSNFNFFANGTYGLTDTLQGEFRVGFGGAKSYVGGFLKNWLARGTLADVSVWGGIHHQGNTYLDVAPIFSHPFSGIDPYVSPLFLIKFDGPGDTLGAALVPGVSLPLTPHVKAYGEFTLNVANYYSAFSFGARYFF